MGDIRPCRPAAATGGGRMAKGHHPVAADHSNPACVQSL